LAPHIAAEKAGQESRGSETRESNNDDRIRQENQITLGKKGSDISEESNLQINTSPKTENTIKIAMDKFELPFGKSLALKQLPAKNH
jgi:hypothetical protein